MKSTVSGEGFFLQLSWLHMSTDSELNSNGLTKKLNNPLALLLLLLFAFVLVLALLSVLEVVSLVDSCETDADR